MPCLLFVQDAGQACVSYQRLPFKYRDHQTARIFRVFCDKIHLLLYTEIHLLRVTDAVFRFHSGALQIADHLLSIFRPRAAQRIAGSILSGKYFLFEYHEFIPHFFKIIPDYNMNFLNYPPGIEALE